MSMFAEYVIFASALICPPPPPSSRPGGGDATASDGDQSAVRGHPHRARDTTHAPSPGTLRKGIFAAVGGGWFGSLPPSPPPWGRGVGPACLGRCPSSRVVGGRGVYPPPPYPLRFFSSDKEGTGRRGESGTPCPLGEPHPSPSYTSLGRVPGPHLPFFPEVPAPPPVAHRGLGRLERGKGSGQVWKLSGVRARLS